jgi:predicted HTH transcriptional regulator
VTYLISEDKSRVVEPEGKTLEYKRDLSSPDRAMRAVVAFANSAGGRLVIGVEDDGTVVGVADPLLERERLTNLIADWVSPQLMPTIELVPLADATVVVADVALSIRRPHYLTKHGKDEGTYIRLGASNRKAGPDIIAELGRSARGIPFDRLPATGATLEDLDTDALGGKLGRELDPHALQTLELVAEDQGRLVPTNGGVLVASPNPEHFFPFAWVQCARFRGSTKRDIWDQQEIYGPLPLAVDKVMRFLEQNAFRHAEFGDVYRRDRWSIPTRALREIVTNALTHASYSVHGTPIKVAFMDSAIEVESPGGLMPSLTVEEMTQGVSVIRNPVIARVFRELGLIERWGTGLPEAIRQLAEAGLPAPDIAELAVALRVTVHIEDQSVAPAGEPSDKAESRLRHIGTSGLRHIGTASGAYVPKLDVAVPKSAAAVLLAAQAGSASRSDLLSAIGLSQSTNNYRRHVLPLVEAGLLALSIPSKPRSPLQRYILTALGQEWLDHSVPRPHAHPAETEQG